MNKYFCGVVASCAIAFTQQAVACTGITLQSQNGDRVTARSIEWGSSVLSTNLVVVPRGHATQTQTAQGPSLSYKNTWGYVGLSIEDKNFVVEGLNEKGLSAGLFFFPGYGLYPDYDKKQQDKMVSYQKAAGQKTAAFFIFLLKSYFVFSENLLY